MNTCTHATALIDTARRLSETVGRLQFSPPVSHVYNPLEYAWPIHQAYLERYANGRKRIIFVGMNPGPFGMVQTGVPFGEIAVVRDWLGLGGQVGRPSSQNPKRPVEGLACARSEVSGRRLWGLFRERFATPGAFFSEHFVANYCPLAFFDGGRNLTPDKLPAVELQPLLETCDAHLRSMTEILEPDWVIGIGAWAEGRAAKALTGLPLRIGRVLHPSPASPAANRGWSEAASRQLQALGVWTD